MSELEQARRTWKTAQASKADIIARITAKLGNNSGVVLTGEPDEVYARLPGGNVIRVLNKLAPPIYDLEVELGKGADNHFQVLAVVDSTGSGLGSGGGGGSYALTLDQIQRELRYGYPGGGKYPLWVEGNQVMPFSVLPVAGSLSVRVYRAPYWSTADGWITVEDMVDLSSYAPENAGEGRLILITISDDGDVVATPGTTVVLEEVTEFPKPDPPAGTRWLLAFVRMLYGATQFTYHRSNPDFSDLRWLGMMPTANALAELTDVDLTGLSDGDFIAYDLASETWKPTSVAPGTPAGIPFKVTKLQGSGDKTTTSSTFTQIDGTNLGYLTLDCVTGDVIEISLCAQAYTVSGGTETASVDFDVDRPTSANERANESCDGGSAIFYLTGARSWINVITTYVITEDGVHGFSPVWKRWGTTDTLIMRNATSGINDGPIIFSVKNLGQPAA